MNLAVLLREKFALTYDIGFLNKAIALHEQVSRSLKCESPQSIATDPNLAQCLFDRSKLLGDAVYRKRALELLRHSLARIPGNHSQSVLTLITLGSLLKAKESGREHDETELEASIKTFEEALEGRCSTVFQSIKAARGGAEAYVAKGDLDRAYGHLEKASGFMSLLSPRWMESVDRQDVLSLVRGLPEDAATLEFLAGKSPQQEMTPKPVVVL